MLINRKAIIASFLVLLVAAPSSLINAQNAAFVEGETPVFNFEPNPNGYGGPSGELPEGGLFEIDVFFPNNSLTSEFPSSVPSVYTPPSYQTSYAVEIPQCNSADGGLICTYIWGENHSEVESVEPGNYRFDVQYDDPDNPLFTKQVVYVDDEGNVTPYLPLNILGTTNGPIGYFDNNATSRITDASQQTVPVHVLTRTDQDIDRVEFLVSSFGEAGRNLVTVQDFTTVPNEDYIGGEARQYSLDWEVGDLPAGTYIINASIFDTSGRRSDAEVSVNNAQSFLEYTLAVDVNERLTAQCEENKEAVDLLISSILDDIDTDSAFLEEAVTKVITFRETLDVSSDELDQFEDSYLTKLNDMRTAVANTKSLSTISCDVSLRDDIEVFRSAHDDYKTALNELTDALVDYSNTLIEEARSGQ